MSNNQHLATISIQRPYLVCDICGHACSCYSPYLSYLGIDCSSGAEKGSVDVKTIHDAAMKSERLDEVFESLKDFLQNKTVTPLRVCNRTHARILQQLSHLPPKIEFQCCKGNLCNAPQRDIGACFVGENTRDMTEATSSGALPGEVQNIARGCLEVPGATSGTCVTFTQSIMGRLQRTGMCYSDVLRAGYSDMDWIGIKVDCSTNSSAEGLIYLFDNIPNTTDGITPPPPETGNTEQVAGEPGARFDHMKASSDPVARPTYQKMQEASKIAFKCCKGLLCNAESRPDGDKLLNYSSNVTAILIIDGFKSAHAGRGPRSIHVCDNAIVILPHCK